MLTKVIIEIERMGYKPIDIAEELLAVRYISYENAATDLAKMKKGDTTYDSRMVDYRHYRDVTKLTAPEKITMHGIEVTRPPGVKPGLTKYPTIEALGKRTSLTVAEDYPSLGRQQPLYQPKVSWFKKPTDVRTATARKEELVAFGERVAEQRRLGRLPERRIKTPTLTTAKLGRMWTKAVGRASPTEFVKEKLDIPNIWESKPHKVVLEEPLEQVPTGEITSKEFEARKGRLARRRGLSKVQEISAETGEYRDVPASTRYLDVTETRGKVSVVPGERPTKTYTEQIRPKGDIEVAPRKYAKSLGVRIVKPEYHLMMDAFPQEYAEIYTKYFEEYVQTNKATAKEIETTEAEVLIKDKFKILEQFNVLSCNDYHIKIPLESRHDGSHRGFIYIEFTKELDVRINALIKVLLHDSFIYLDSIDKLYHLAVFWVKKINTTKEVTRILKRGESLNQAEGDDEIEQGYVTL